MSSMMTPQRTKTNAQGAFTFTRLPAGAYRVVASPPQHAPQYLAMSYGGTKALRSSAPDSGRTISLEEGQTFDKVAIALVRGAVISGRVTGESSEPLAQVQVHVVMSLPGRQRGQRIGPPAQTDDLGQFRVYGLPTGDYVVVAESRLNTYEQPGAPPGTEDEKIGYLTTYYPAGADEAYAARVRARAGAETSGIEIRLLQGRLLRVSGSVIDSKGQPLTGVNGQLSRRGLQYDGGTTYGFSTDAAGAFRMRNVPPGEYRLSVQQLFRDFTANGGMSTPGEMASITLTLATDLENVVVTTMPGATITGRIVIEQRPESMAAGPIRVMAVLADPMEMGRGIPQPPPAATQPDLTFTMKGLMGELLLRPAAPNLYVKSIVVGTQDVTDTPREFRNNEQVIVTLTSRASMLEGSVSAPAGSASVAGDATVVVFSQEKSSWHPSAVRTRRASVDADGRFRITGLLPGSYFVAAMRNDHVSMGSGPLDASFFERVSKDAIPVVIGEDEQRRLDLRLTEWDPGSGRDQ
jgi:hypothetical protein